jgi:deoxycytidine triphosphate deaminase
MYINPKHAIEQGWITHPACQSLEDWHDLKLINPNAIDFTLDRLFTVDAGTSATITESQRTFRDTPEIECNDDGLWELSPNQVYDGLSNMRVEVPNNVACMLVNRSTFNRCGVHLNSGLYDSFFSGNIGFTLTNRSGPLFTKPGTRVGQIIFVSSDASGQQYTGIYNGAEDGTHWSEHVS